MGDRHCLCEMAVTGAEKDVEGLFAFSSTHSMNSVHAEQLLVPALALRGGREQWTGQMQSPPLQWGDRQGKVRRATV